MSIAQATSRSEREAGVGRERWGVGRTLWSGLFSASCTAAVAFIVWNFPVARIPLAAFAILYAAVLMRWRDAWLVLLPPLVVGVDLAPWSGRWLVTELDVLLLTTLAVVTWDRGRPRRPADDPAGTRHVLVLLTLGVWGIATVIGMEGRWPPPFDEFAAHRGVHEGIRTFKALGYAAALLAALSRVFGRGTERAQRLLGLGFGLGLCVVGLEVAWDRSVFRHLVAWHDVYAFAADLLDVTSTYRTTAAFAGMHTGGAPLDAFLMLALPFAMALLLAARGWGIAAFAVICLALGAYALLGTFTRASYAGFAVSVIVIAAVWLGRHRGGVGVARGTMALSCALLGLGFAVTMLVYGRGGFQALAAASGALAAGIVLAGLRRPRRFAARVAVATGVALLLAGVAGEGIVESKWNAGTPLGLAVALALAAAALVAPGWWLGQRLSSSMPRVTVLSLAAALALGLVLGVPAVGGYRMGERFAQVDADLETRAGHWRDVLALARDDVLGLTFGAGSGSFARRYFWTHLGAREAGSLRFDDAQGHGVLHLGAGPYNVMQRVPVLPETRYQLRVRARALGGSVRVSAKLCHKNVLYSEHWTPNCPQWVGSFRSGEEWREATHHIESGVLGRYGAFYWPVTLLLHHEGGDGVLEIDAVRLLDPSGRDLIANGGFESRAERWFFVSDFQHLPWHAKNILLHLFVEQGVVGLAVFLLLVAMAVRRALRMRRNGEILAGAVLAGLAALAVLSMFATIIDEPRLVLLIYFTLFAVLYLPPAKPEPRVRAD